MSLLPPFYYSIQQWGVVVERGLSKVIFRSASDSAMQGSTTGGAKPGHHASRLKLQQFEAGLYIQT
jgi:hypothetical protein